jgi:hypothetical protein
MDQQEIPDPNLEKIRISIDLAEIAQPSVNSPWKVYYSGRISSVQKPDFRTSKRTVVLQFVHHGFHATSNPMKDWQEGMFSTNPL